MAFIATCSVITRGLAFVPETRGECKGSRGERSRTQPIFFATDDYGKFLEDLGVTSQAYSCEIHAYVLMTNHVHLLLTPKIAGAVSQMMQALGRRYVRYINVVRDNHLGRSCHPD